MESDVKVEVLINGESHFDYTVQWQGDEVVNIAEVPLPAQGVDRLEIKVGRCVCKMVECPVHGEVNERRSKEGV